MYLNTDVVVITKRRHSKVPCILRNEPLFATAALMVIFAGVFRAYGIDKHAVTNDQFAAFVKATGYVTEAEKFEWSFVLE